MSLTSGPNLGLLINGTLGEQHYNELMRLFRGLDGLIQIHVKSATTSAEPGSPTDGDIYALPVSCTGTHWAGNDGKLARYSSVAAAWEFYTPKEGWNIPAEDSNFIYKYDGSAWKFYKGYGTTANRPLASVTLPGAEYYDTDKTVEVISDATQWRPVTGYVTGVVTGCEPTATNGTAVFSIAAGTLIFVDDYTTPGVPQHKLVTYAGGTNISDAYTSSSATFIGINSSGTVVQQTTAFTNLQSRTIATLFNITKSGGLIIASAPFLTTAYNDDYFVHDVVRILGSIVSGCRHYGIAGLQYARAAGTLFRPGAYYNTSKTTPNEVTLTAQSPCPTIANSRNGGNTTFTSSGVITTLTVNVYDNGGSSSGGIPTGTVTTDSWQAMRLYLSSSGNTFLQYGTATYASLSAAKEGVYGETFYPAPITELLNFRGYLFVRGGAANLNDAADAVFVNAGKLGDVFVF